MVKLGAQLGPARPPLRLGFSFIYRGAEGLRRVCRAVGRHGLSIGVSFNLQTHNLLPGVDELLDTEKPIDLRLHRWRQDVHWHGIDERLGDSKLKLERQVPSPRCSAACGEMRGDPLAEYFRLARR